MLDLKAIKKAGVADGETVARAMFSPSFFKRSGAIGAQAFFLTPFHGTKILLMKMVCSLYHQP